MRTAGKQTSKLGGRSVRGALGRAFAGEGPVYPWLVELAIVFFLLVAVGLGSDGYPFGVLVDGRNKISLSRLQIILWTNLFVATFWVLYVWNVGRAPSGGG
jgi:hypothetical protein